MYDESIQEMIDFYKIAHPIQTEPIRLQDLIKKFESADPVNVILTGTAGDGKTYHCRRVWEHFGGNNNEWQHGKKIVSLALPNSKKRLCIIKDLSELNGEDKRDLFPYLAAAVAGENENSVYLVAANDGQLVSSWREWAELNGTQSFAHFKAIERMLVENDPHDQNLQLHLYNLSRMDASKHFDVLVEQIVENPQWRECEGCELLSNNESTTCPIRINRELLRRGETGSPFRVRLSHLLRLAGANQLYLPIRDLLLLAVNIMLGDRKIRNRPLLTCRTAKNRAKDDDYAMTNPYGNTFGANLSKKDRRKYQAFTTLDSFGVGRETDNAFDNLLIYGDYSTDHEKERYERLIGCDHHYGAQAYRKYLQDYLEGERENTREFMVALEYQRCRLFFSLPVDNELNPWHLTVYRSAGTLLQLAEKIENNKNITQLAEQLVRGLNRTFCGMMIDDGTRVYLGSSGGDGRRRVASVLSRDLRTAKHRRDIYITFDLAEDKLTPQLQVIDPTKQPSDQKIDQLDLHLTHFEYLMRVSNGSLPASFSRQCYEDFLDFKLRLIEQLDDLYDRGGDTYPVAFDAIQVDGVGRLQIDDIRIMADS